MSDIKNCKICGALMLKMNLVSYGENCYRCPNPHCSDLEKGTVLTEAKEIINGKRNDQYGEPEDSFEGIALRWGRYLSKKNNKDIIINPIDVAHMMAELKMERELNSPKRDNLADACGYLAIKADLTKTRNKY